MVSPSRCVSSSFAASLCTEFHVAPHCHSCFVWNWLIPCIFHSEPIDLWQAFGLLALSRILFANFGNSFWQHNHKCNQCGGSGLFQQKQHWREKMKAKMETMSPDDREDFKAQMKNICRGASEKNEVI